MKNLFLLLTFISTHVNCQNLFESYRGIWINERHEVLMILDTLKGANNRNNDLSGDRPAFFRYSFSYNNDTLNFRNSYRNYLGDQSDLYSFKVLSINDSFLTVRPLSSFSKTMFSNRNSIKFIRQEYAVDTSLKFEKLVYNLGSSCFPGPCDGIYLEINSKKEIYLDLLFYKDFSVDSLKSGSFSGIMDDSLYSKFINLIQTCNLSTLMFSDSEGNDGQIVDFIFYYNGKEKHLKSIHSKLVLNRVANKGKLVEQF